MPEQEEPYGGFVRDGIVNLENWKKQKVRICFILNEAGGRGEMPHYPDGSDLAAEWNEKGSFSKFMFKLSVWTKAIQDSFNPPNTYNKGDVSKIRDELIRSIAIVNIKKSDGQRRSDFELLQRFAAEDAEELKKELELVNPNIIICGENMKFLRGKRPEEEGAKRNFVFYEDELKQIAKFTYLWGSKLVLSLWTPANFFGTISSNTLNYYAVREISRAALKALALKNARAKIKKENDAAHERKLKEKAARAQAKKLQAEGNAQPAGNATPAENVKPAEAATAETTAKPEEAVKAPETTATTTEAVKPEETVKAAETATPTETAKPAETAKAEKTTKTTRTKKTAKTEETVKAEETAATEETPKKKTTRTRKTAQKDTEETKE